jgi:hypothetical protein
MGAKARRIDVNIAKLPDLLRRERTALQQMLGFRSGHTSGR